MANARPAPKPDRRFRLWLTEESHSLLKMAAAKEGRTMQEVAAQVLTDYAKFRLGTD